MSDTELLEEVAHTGNSDAAVALLSAFSRGLPLENLVPLFSSTNDQVVKAAAWIASELGAKAAPIFSNIGLLLGSHIGYVRFFALDWVLICASLGDSETLARAVELVVDSDSRVRWKTMWFLSRATHGQLSASLLRLSDRELRESMEWLIEHGGNSADQTSIDNRLKDQSVVRRRFAAVAAARQALAGQGASGLQRAAECDDLEVSEFAAEVLEDM